MQDLLSIGTNRRESMIGTGIGLGLAGYRLNPPGVLPVLDLRFATDKSLTAFAGPTPSFSRASSGTYFDANGVLQSAGVNAARFNHVYNGTSWVSRGLLLEEQRTNLSQRSEDFSHTYYSKSDSSISANQIAAPDGATTADKLVENTANAIHYFSSSGYMTTNQTYACSIFAKAAERNWIKIYIWNGSTSLGAWFNLSSGTIGTTESGITSSIQNVGNGWYRCSITRTVSSGLPENGLGVILATADNSVTYTGDGSSGVYVWGSQVEAGSFSTSYIGTTSSSVTRSADVCQITGVDFSGFWNGTEGSISIDFDNNTINFGTRVTRVLTAWNSGKTQGIVLDNRDSSTSIEINPGANFTYSPPVLLNKIAFAYKENDFAISRNGDNVLTDISGAVPAGVVQLNIGNNDAGSIFHNGHIARLRYYRTRLENGTLRVLST